MTKTDPRSILSALYNVLDGQQEQIDYLSRLAKMQEDQIDLLLAASSTLAGAIMSLAILERPRANEAAAEAIALIADAILKEDNLDPDDEPDDPQAGALIDG